MLKFLERHLAEFLKSPGHSRGASPTTDAQHLLRGGKTSDVLLVDAAVASAWRFGTSHSRLGRRACVEELLRVRHHSLFVPRGFDVYPYFEIAKPTIGNGFDYRAVKWEPETPQAANVVSLRTRTPA